MVLFLACVCVLAFVVGTAIRSALALWGFRSGSVLVVGQVIAVEPIAAPDKDGARLGYLCTFAFRPRGREQVVTARMKREEPLVVGAQVPVRYHPSREIGALVWLPARHWMHQLVRLVAGMGSAVVLFHFRGEIYWPLVALFGVVALVKALARSVEAADAL